MATTFHLRSVALALALGAPLLLSGAGPASADPIPNPHDCDLATGCIPYTVPDIVLPDGVRDGVLLEDGRLLLENGVAMYPPYELGPPPPPFVERLLDSCYELVGDHPDPLATMMCR